MGVTMDWQVGDRLTHRLNSDLGPGEVVEVDGRFLVARFPKTNQVLRLAIRSGALERLVLRPGVSVHHLPSGSRSVVDRVLDSGRVLLLDGQEVDELDLWPDEIVGDLLAGLAAGKVGSQEAFSLRLDMLRLASIREADGLGSFLGGRIHLFPHQLYVAERATRTDPVRWLLADEVGLGKTVESCLILNHLLRTGRALQTLVVAPDTLTVQWLGELWRKYHQVFVLLDEKRLQDVEKDYGKGFNPFDAFERAVVSLELLVAMPRLSEQAVEAGIDLLVVDEAHHLRRRRGHPGNAAYRAVEPIVAASRHVLLLTAVPLEDDAHGFFRLLQLLRPDELPDFEEFSSRLHDGRRLPACTSATRRVDIGGLPPRIGRPVELADDDAWAVQAALVDWLRGRPANKPMAEKRKAASIRAALAWPGAMVAHTGRAQEPELHDLAVAAESCDPRVEWLLDRAPEWQKSGDRSLVFVAERETLEALRAALDRRKGLRVGAFHEEMSAKQRDIEVAQFRLKSGPSILISTECGGEGRNFEFCTRIVLFDLPWNPIVVEQRIGRLDRIGRTVPVEIVYFKPPRGLGATVARLYEELGLFERPIDSLERELRGVEEAIERLALGKTGHSKRAPSGDELEGLLSEAREARHRVESAVYAELHREPYRAELGSGILERVPPELEVLTRAVVLAACFQLGLQVEEHDGGKRYWIQFDARARVESLPGLIGEASFLGTFYREEAVDDETIDYFASGHPLVEGILAHLEEAPLGRIALLDISDDGGGRQLGLFAAYKDGADFEAVAFDLKGRERPEWCERILRQPFDSRPVRTESWVDRPSWQQLIRKLGQCIEGREKPVAIAALRAG